MAAVKKYAEAHPDPSSNVLTVLGAPAPTVQACEPHVRGLELGFAAAGTAASAGGPQPVGGAFGEQVALELADSAEHREEHAPGGG
jgi:hypothetical protein